MAAGDILKEQGLVVETFTVAADEDIEKGEIVRETGAGIAAAAATEKGPFYMAMEDHVYADETDHDIECVVRGYVEVQKAAAAGAAEKGQWLEISATAGKVQVFDYTTPGAWYEVVGEAMEASLDADTTQKLRLG